MARGVKKEKAKAMLTPEEKLAAALVPVEEQPYRVPGNWCWVYGKAFLRPMETKKPTGDVFTYIDIDSVDNKRQEVTEPKKVKTNEAPSRASRALHSGDTIFSMVRPYLKNIAYIDNTIADSIASTGFYVCSPRAEVFSKYNFYMMISPYVIDGLNTYMKGDNSPSIRKENIEQFPFPIPPFSEQHRIVHRINSLFAKLDEAKEKAQAVVDSFEDRKAAILHKAFTGELTQNWRKSNKVDYSSWKTKTLSDTSIQIIDGDRGKNYPRKDEFSPEGYCIFLSAKNVTKRGFVFKECEYITKEKDELLHNGKLERGDMVMTTRGTIGNVAIYDDTVPFEHLRINSGMVIYRGGNEFVKQYLIWLYQSEMITNQIDVLSTGTAQPQLPIKVMNALQLPIPPLDEQTEIISVLDRMIEKEVNAKEAAEQTLSQIDTMKKSILARAFRGELGTNDPTDENAIELLRKMLQTESEAKQHED